jgi:hypothetical protein
MANMWLMRNTFGQLAEGRVWRPAKTPHRVRDHDFVIPGVAGGKAIPYAV